LKLYGPELSKAIPILEEIGNEFGKLHGTKKLRDSGPRKEEVFIKSSSISIGKYDYRYEWFEAPDIDKVLSLILKIDERLKTTRLKYEVTTVEIGKEDVKGLLKTGKTVSYIKFMGPGIFEALDKMGKFNLDVIDSHGLAMGWFDYYLLWNETPTSQAIINLSSTIDSVLDEIKDYNVLYNITTIDVMKEKKEFTPLDHRYLKIKMDKSGVRWDLTRRI
jgi:hypothetical protein